MSIIVSISCITYNHAPYIRECLDSFLMQKTTFQIEVVIHDDCSSDGTREIIEEYAVKYPDIIFPMFQTENQYSKGVRGMMALFNFPRCNGNYIALCDGDDFWTDPYKLQNQVNFLELNLDFSICFHGMNILDDSVGNFVEITNEDQISVSTILDLASKGNFMYTASVVFRKPKENFPEWLKGLPIADYPLYLYIAQFGKIKFLNDLMGVYRIHSGGVWGALSKEILYDRWIPMLLALENKFTPEVNVQLVYQKKNALFDLYLISSSQGNQEKSAECIKQLMGYDTNYLARKFNNLDKKFNKTLNSNAYKIGTMLIKIFTFPTLLFKTKK